MNEAMLRQIRETACQMNRFNAENELFEKKECGLPDRKEIVLLTEKLRGMMFPGYFQDQFLVRGEFSYGQALTECAQRLEKILANAFGINGGCDCAKIQAEDVCRHFIGALAEVQKALSCDVEAAFNGDPAAKTRAEIVFSYPGLYATAVYRLAHILYNENVPLIPRIMTEYAHSLTGIDINAGAKIGSYFFIDHGTGVVIGETAEIGDFAKIYQGVTLGALSTRKGQALSGVKRHPTLKNRVTVYSGASILGGDTIIGDDCVIGGNAFVISSVPDNTRVSVKSPELTFREMNKNIWEKA